MPKPCSVCNHPAAPMIDQQLKQSVPYRQIAVTFGVSKSALMRHAQHGMPQADHEPGHATVHEPPRPALDATVAKALRQDLERLQRVIEEDPRLRVQERRLHYGLGIVLKMIDALSANAQQH